MNLKKVYRDVLHDDTKLQLRALGIPEVSLLCNELAVTDGFEEMPFAEKMEFIINRLYQEKSNDRIKRLKRQAKLRDPNASMPSLQYIDGRNLKRSTMMEISTCDYMKVCKNIVIEGPTGSGKTFLGCAIGNAAIEKSYRVRYIRFPDLLTEIIQANESVNKRTSLLKRYAKYTLLIIDEWMLVKPIEPQILFIYDLLERRYTENSTVFCTQSRPQDWHEYFGGTICAESIIDRIIHNQINIVLGDLNMRETVYQNL